MICSTCFGIPLAPSSGADVLVVFFLLVVKCRGCLGGQIRLAGCVSTGEYVAQLASCATYSPMDTQPANRI